MDLLVKKVEKFEAQQSSESDNDSGSDGNAPARKKQVFDSVKALIISPTRELAIQIRDMINAVIPIDMQD